jgi:hypothetical protein
MFIRHLSQKHDHRELSLRAEHWLGFAAGLRTSGTDPAVKPYA